MSTAQKVETLCTMLMKIEFVWFANHLKSIFKSKQCKNNISNVKTDKMSNEKYMFIICSTFDTRLSLWISHSTYLTQSLLLSKQRAWRQKTIRPVLPLLFLQPAQTLHCTASQHKLQRATLLTDLFGVTTVIVWAQQRV